MTVALSLLLGAMVTGWLTPVFLTRRVHRGSDPVVAMVAWLAAAVAVAGASITSVLLVLLPNHGVSHSPLTALHHCWSAVQHGAAPSVEAVSGVFAAVLLAGLTVRLVIVAVRSARRRARARAEHLATLRLAARQDGETLWLDHDQPLAFSLAGKPGVIVATEGLARHLTGAQVEAVLEHERAHLTGRHHLLVAIGEALAGTLPFVPLFRQAPDALRSLVEMVADIAAARVCGAEVVRSALVKVSGHGAPSTALAMSSDAVDVRVARLRRGTVAHGHGRQLVACVLMALVTLALPTLAAIGSMLSVIALTCLI